jgi:hypothetical protein
MEDRNGAAVRSERNEPVRAGPRGSTVRKSRLFVRAGSGGHRFTGSQRSLERVTSRSTTPCLIRRKGPPRTTTWCARGIEAGPMASTMGHLVHHTAV